MRTFTRDSAARISFLMAIPVTGGAAVYKVGKLVIDGIPDGLALPMVVGIITSAVAGWLAVAWVLQMVRSNSFKPFVIYRVTLGVIVLVIAIAGWR